MKSHSPTKYKDEYYRPRKHIPTVKPTVDHEDGYESIDAAVKFVEDDLPEQWKPYLRDTEEFFTEVLPGQDEPIGSPGGAAKPGVLGVDTPLVASHPKQDAEK